MLEQLKHMAASVVDGIAWGQWFSSLFLFGLGLLLATFAARSVGRFMAKRASRHHTVMLKRLVFYVIVVIFAVAALREAGFSLDVVLGAAGILTVAIGFAPQTSASNTISGVFLLVEKHPTCLKEPNPFVLVTGFGQSSVDVQFSFWVPREKLEASRSSMMIAVKKMLDREKIEIPLPTPAFTPVAIQNLFVCS